MELRNFPISKIFTPIPYDDNIKIQLSITDSDTQSIAFVVIES